MGLANLVPGISGGTMLVAAGVYRSFIDAVADISRFRLSLGAVVTLGVIVAAAGVAIVGLAGVVAAGLESFRWGMYSLFIGLTLGGAPVLVGMARPLDRRAWSGVAAGIVVMLAIVGVQTFGGAGGSRGGTVLLFLGGIAGASAMILPGVSGAYLLLLLGVYDTIIGSIKDAVSAAADRDVQGVIDQLGVVVPVGLGVVVGVVGVSSLLKIVLRRFEKATLGVLLGLLLAAPAGLYPFREGVPPRVGDTFEGTVVTEESLADIDAKDWPEQTFTPTSLQVAAAFGLVVLGAGVTLGVARLGGSNGTRANAAPPAA